MEDPSWHLDKKVPLGLIIGLMFNALCGIWYASKLDSRVAILEQQVFSFESSMNKLREDTGGSRERLIRVEDKLEHILEGIKKLESHNTLNLRPTL